MVLEKPVSQNNLHDTGLHRSKILEKKSSCCRTDPVNDHSKQTTGKCCKQVCSRITDNTFVLNQGTDQTIHIGTENSGSYPYQTHIPRGNFQQECNATDNECTKQTGKLTENRYPSIRPGRYRPQGCDQIRSSARNTDLPDKGIGSCGCNTSKKECRKYRISGEAEQN